MELSIDELNKAQRESIQQYILENSADKPKGAQFYNRGIYFKIEGNTPYYYHESQRIWISSVLLTCSEVREFYHC